MRIFASDKVGGLMKKLGMQAGEAIEHPWVTRAIENAQRKVEGHNFDIRKQLLEYDDVANDQRKVIYAQRNEMMSSDDLSEIVRNIREDVVNDIVSEYIPHGSLDEQWDLDGLQEAIKSEFGQDMPVKQWMDDDADLNEQGLRQKILDTLLEDYAAKEQIVGAEGMRPYEKYILLQVLGRLDHQGVMELARREGMILLAGRYEGIDERLLETEVDEEWSIGDYVLSGGELAAMVLIDAVVRQLPGALGDEDSARQDSFVDGLLDCAHYTRPEAFAGRQVPKVLVSGNHEKIRQWRLKQSLGRTWLRRPDLIEKSELTNEQRQLLEEFQREHEAPGVRKRARSFKKLKCSRWTRRSLILPRAIPSLCM